jgi:tetratricopeptide (TPR) repeat protein/nucleoside phosphorylase
MEEHIRSFDVCVVCALSEEVRAFLEVVRSQGESVLEEGKSPGYHYSYRFATIKNNKDEPLNLHISWLPRYGPQEMALHLSHVLEECQPRIALMTGICAGDSKQAHLGDLVVAERTFTYDSGKFTRDERGRRVHLHDTLTYQLDANILQFLWLFDEWKPLVAELERPPSPPGQRDTTCHIKAMASGSAVRADHPFEDVQVPVRGTVAIDMEGAAFGMVMSRNPLTPWLVVKGVCDYADQQKNDAYHDYAARASALYALSFIRAYVTNERFPSQDGRRAVSRDGPPGVWNVPYLRNPHFTGRDELLDQLTQRLAPETRGPGSTARRAALTQPQAIKGLGGIGKTQIAVEYAYRSHDLDRYAHTLWVNAESEGALLINFITLADLLPSFQEKGEKDQRKLVEAIKRWLEQCPDPWLLIFDNADDVTLVTDYLPKQGLGSILLTTRTHAVGSLATSIEVETMGLIEGTHLLLRRAQRLENASDEEINRAGDIVVALDHFPLALDQAGAYLEETQCSLGDYLEVYQNHRKTLLALRGKQAVDYPDSVATTWSLSFQKVQQADPAAAELLQLCAFLAPDRIPEELIKDGAGYWPLSLQQAAKDLLAFQQMIGELLKFSLVKRLAEEHMLSIHTLVQAVQVDMMEPERRPQWAERVVRAVNEVFPRKPKDVGVWQECRRYLSQAQACDALIKQYMLPLIEGADLLHRVGFYLAEQALYDRAEPLYQHSLSIYERQRGPDHPLVASTLNNLALLYREEGKYEEAKIYLDRSLGIREQRLSDLAQSYGDTAQSLSNKASVYQRQGNYAEAESLYKKALGFNQLVYGQDHSEVATVMNNLAGLYELQGRYPEAEPLYRQALSIWKRQSEPDPLLVATSLNNLAGLSQREGKYREAESLYEQALTIREQHLEPDHPDKAQTLSNLATAYLHQGKYAEAGPLLERSLSIYEQRLGPRHPDTATAMNNLAACYRAQEKPAEAESLYVRTLIIREQELGAGHPLTAECLSNLASLYRDQGKYEEAEPLFKRALSIYEQQLEPEHPITAALLNNLALLYYYQGRYEEAEPLYLRALKIQERVLGARHPSTQNTRTNYNALLLSRAKNGVRKTLRSLFPRRGNHSV